MADADNIKLLIKISEEAADVVKMMQDENENPEMVLTLLSAGVGCGAPAIKIEMKHPQENDLINETGGFKFHIRSAIVKFLDNAEIITEDTFWGKKLKVKTVSGCR